MYLQPLCNVVLLVPHMRAIRTIFAATPQNESTFVYPTLGIDYVLRRGNTWLVGLDANIAAWQHTRLGAIWRLLSWPLVKPMADWLYRQWAERRFASRYPGDN